MKQYNPRLSMQTTHRRSRHLIIGLFITAIMVTIGLAATLRTAFAAPYPTPNTEVVLAVDFDGTRLTGNPGTSGEDETANNGIVRTFDSFGYRIDWNVNEQDATNVTLETTFPITLPLAWDAVPEGCDPALSTISADLRTLTCHLGDREEGTSGTIFATGTITDTYAGINDTTWTVETTIDTDQNPAPIVSNSETLTISSRAELNMLKGEADIYRNVDKDGVSGAVLVWPIMAAPGANGRYGSEPPSGSGPITLYDHLHANTSQGSPFTSPVLITDPSVLGTGYPRGGCGQYDGQGAELIRDPSTTTGMIPADIPGSNGATMSCVYNATASATHGYNVYDLVIDNYNFTLPATGVNGLPNEESIYFTTQMVVWIPNTELFGAGVNQATYIHNAITGSDAEVVLDGASTNDPSTVNDGITMPTGTETELEDNAVATLFGATVPAPGISYRNYAIFIPGPYEEAKVLNQATGYYLHSADERRTEFDGLGNGQVGNDGLEGASNRGEQWDWNDPVSRNEIVTLNYRLSTSTLPGSSADFDDAFYQPVHGCMHIDNTYLEIIDFPTFTIDEVNATLSGPSTSGQTIATTSGSASDGLAHVLYGNTATTNGFYNGDNGEPDRVQLDPTFTPNYVVEVGVGTAVNVSGATEHSVTCNDSDGTWYDTNTIASDPAAQAALGYDPVTGRYANINMVRVRTLDPVPWINEQPILVQVKGSDPTDLATYDDGTGAGFHLFLQAQVKDTLTAAPNGSPVEIISSRARGEDFYDGQDPDIETCTNGSAVDDAAGTFNTTATGFCNLTYAAPIEDIDSANTIVHRDTIIVEGPKLSINKTRVTDQIAEIGDLVTFRIDLGAKGPAIEPIDNYIMTDPIPSWATFVSIDSQPAGTTCTTTAAGSITCNFGTIDPSTFTDVMTVTYRMKVGSANQLKKNTATVNGDAGGTALTPAVGVASVRLPGPFHTLEVEKRVANANGDCTVFPDWALMGLTAYDADMAGGEWADRCEFIDVDGNASFSLVVTNTGSVTLENVQLIDVLPHQSGALGDDIEGQTDFFGTPQQTAPDTLGDGRFPMSDFLGTSEFVSASGFSNIFYSTAAPETIVRDPDHVSNAGCTSAIWSATAPANLGDVTALCFEVANMGPGGVRTVNVTIDTEDNDNLDMYTNTFGARSETIKLPNRSNDVSVMPQAILIGSTVFYDANDDGIQDPSTDYGVAGVTVDLLDGAGNVISTTVTNASGDYLFEGFPPGDYQLVVTPPADYPASSTPTTAAESPTSATITGALPGAANIMVDLVDATGAVIASVMTDASGNYEFVNVPAGDYTVEVFAGGTTLSAPVTAGPSPVPVDGDDNGDQPGGSGTPISSTVFTVEWGSGINDSIETFQANDQDNGVDGNNDDPVENNGNMTLDFGLIGPGRIGDTIWHDADGDGSQAGADEPGLSGVVVTLEDSFGNVFTTTTSPTGTYSFENLPVNTTYTVTVDTTTLPGDKNTVATGDPQGDGDSTSVVDLTTDMPENLDQDFGYEPLGSLGSTLFHDTNGDGIYNAGDLPLDGVEVILTYPDGATATMMTDASGMYTFTDLALNEMYTVTVNTDTLPGDKFAEPTGDAGNMGDEESEGTITLTTMLTNDMPDDPMLDFGFTVPGSIGDLVFHDKDNDGVYNPAVDGLLPGVLVTLTNTTTGEVMTTTTGADGRYLFDDLPFGDYTVEVDTSVLPEGKAPEPTGTSGNTGEDESEGTTVISVTIDQDNPDETGADFGFGELGTIGNTIFHDIDGDGVYDPAAGDFPLSGVEVELTYPDGATETVMTDGNGFYEFTGLDLDETYTVTLNTATLPGTKDPNATGDSSLTADQTSEGTIVLTTTISADGTREDPQLDFGFQPYGSLGSTLFHDLDGDGMYEPGDDEFPLDGVTVILTLPDGMTVTTMTDSDGNYEFTELPLGETYTVTVDTSTLPDSKSEMPTGDESLTGDEMSEGVTVLTTTLTVDDPIDEMLDFGFQPAGQIGDTIFHDANGDGEYDPEDGDFPLEGVVVTLTDADGMTETLTTDDEGNYLFTDLEFGDYTVTVDETTLPDGKELDPSGSPDGDNDSEVTLSPENPSDLDQDFGYQPLGVIGNTLFHDLDGDGVYEPEDDEFPLDGVTVILTLPDGMTVTTMTDEDGFYSFTDLPLDETYTVTVDTSTLPDSKSMMPTGDSSLMDDQTSEGTITLTTTLTSEDPSDEMLDFGFQPAGQIGDTIFHDADGDGVYEPDEGDFPLSGVDVTLTYPDGTTETMMTDENGEYLFTDLEFGDYTVTVDPNTLPADKVTDPTASPDGDNESEVSLTAEDPSDLDQDFGYEPLGAIGNTIFHDVDGDGVYDPAAGDFPLSGVEVTLTHSDGTTETMTTDGNGFYQFTDLDLDATYTVTVDTTTLPDNKDENPTGDSSLMDDQTSEGTVTLTTTLTSGPDGMPNDPTLDFGFQPYGSLGSTLFHDLDGDGVYEPGDDEFPLDGVTVILTLPDGSTMMTMTDSDGNYEFTELPLGETYTVTVDTTTLPDSKSVMPTGDDSLTGDEMSEGVTVLTTTLTVDDPSDEMLDFGFQPAGQIGDTIFHDANGDGIYDPEDGDFPLEGVVVTLTDADGMTETLTTDDEGNYLFTDLEFGAYTVTVDETTLPDGKELDPTASPDVDNESEVVLTAEDPSDLDQDFGYQPLGVIGNTLFHDLDGDGVYEPEDDEFPLDGVTVILTLPNGMTETTVTDENGFYSFTDLPLDATYTVTVDTSTLPDSKSMMPTGDSSLTDDQTSEGTITLTTELTSDDPSDAFLDFGFQPAGQIGDTIFHDADGDGVYEPGDGDFPLEGVVVTLTAADGTTETVMTDENGEYLFTDLEFGDYTVTVDPTTLPDGKDIDPTASPDGDNESSVSLTPDDPSDLDQDFGYQPLGAIGDTIFHDANGDGNYDPDAGDFPLEGVEVILTASDGSTMSATTDENGEYLFSDLPLGDYTVEVVTDSLPIDKQDGQTTTTSGEVSLTPEEPSDFDQDFGYPAEVGSIGNTLFHDMNGDGVMNPADGDFPLPGVTVTLIDADGNTWTTVTNNNGNYLFDELPLNTMYTVIVDTNDLPGDKNPDGTEGVDPMTGEDDGEQSVGGSSYTVMLMLDDPTTAEDEQNEGDADFGYESIIGAIGDTIFHDANGDGNYDPDAGDFPLEGVEVILTASDGTTMTTMTDENGNYLFEDLPLGDYTVEVVTSSLPLDKQPDPSSDPEDDGNNMSSVSLTEEMPSDLQQDFGYTPELGSIGDTIWHDEDGDGVQDPDEMGLGGVVVTLTDADGNEMLTMTDDNGNYLFENLPFGDYTVTVATSTLPGDKLTAATGDPDGGADSTSAVSISPEAPDDVDQDFGYAPSGSIGDTIWHDEDGDGVQDPDEMGLSGVVVTLTDADGMTMTAVTDGNGMYLFDDLPYGDYSVMVDPTTLPSDKLMTPTGDPDDVADGMSAVSINADMPDNLDQDFGYEPVLGSIGDTIYHDENGNGMQDEGEPGFANVGVMLTDSSGMTWMTSTDENGNYSFDGLPMGSYIVSVDTSTLPADKQGALNTGDPDGAANSVSAVTLTPDAPDDDEQDFGYLLPEEPVGSIGDTIYHDENGNGVQDADEMGFGGVTVTLLGSDGILRTTMTDANGNYLFVNLPLDVTYTVAVDIETLPGNKAAGMNTGDPEGDANSTSSVTLTEDAPDDLDRDFGYQVVLGSIGDTIYHDENGNGVQDEGEPGLGGVVVVLTDEEGNETIRPTGPNGTYLFDNLPLGTYMVTVATDTLPDGKSLMPTDDPDGGADNTSTVTIDTATPDDVDQDFGYEPMPEPMLGSIGNVIWSEVNGDTSYTLNLDTPLEGVMVKLSAEGMEDRFTSTNRFGLYLFENLPVGVEYTITIDRSTLPIEKQDADTAPNISDPDGGGDGTSVVMLTVGSPVNASQNFGFEVSAPTAVGLTSADAGHSATTLLLTMVVVLLVAASAVTVLPRRD